MKFRVTILELVSSIREVEARDYKELKEFINDEGQYVGKGVMFQASESVICEISDDKGKTYPSIKLL